MCTDKLQEILLGNKSCLCFFHNSPLKPKPIKIPPPMLPLLFATLQMGSITLLFLLMLLSHSLASPLNKKRPINHLAVSVGLGYWCWSELSYQSSWTDMTLKAPKTPSPLPLLKKTNMVKITFWSKCLINLGRTGLQKWKKAFHGGYPLSDVDPVLRERGSHIRGGLC